MSWFVGFVGILGDVLVGKGVGRRGRQRRWWV